MVGSATEQRPGPAGGSVGGRSQTITEWLEGLTGLPKFTEAYMAMVS